MNPKVERILCATDLSDKSASTYRYAIQKAHENNANILVCHIISQRSIKVAKQAAYFLNESQKDVVKENSQSNKKTGVHGFFEKRQNRYNLN